jgi:hypothetical protein
MGLVLRLHVFYEFDGLGSLLDFRDGNRQVPFWC